MERLETAVAVTSAALWQVEREDDGGLVHALDHGDLRELVELVAANPPLEHLAVLRGLCVKPLREFFETIEAPLLLDWDMPGLEPDRPPLPPHDDEGAALTTRTPHHQTLGRSGSLTGLPYRQFTGTAGDSVRVASDFAHREEIDELTWSTEEGFPKIATLHPVVGASNYDVEPLGDSEFFDVRPRTWDPDEVLDRLRQAERAGAKIAILPELCLPEPGALEEPRPVRRISRH